MEKNLIVLILMFIVSFSSNIKYVKADIIDTFSSLILFVIFTCLVFAGIGYWSRRHDKNNYEY